MSRPCQTPGSVSAGLRPDFRPVNRTGIAASVDDQAADETTADAGVGLAPAGSVAELTRCFHCGERCDAASVIDGDQVFCCLGCRTIFGLLMENGLGAFYEMASTPGVRAGNAIDRKQWAYLDDPAVEVRLLDYADARRARTTLSVPAIHCVACVWLLENLPRLCPGVVESRVNFGRREVRLLFDRARVRLSEIVGRLESLGYEPTLMLDALDRKEGGGTRRLQQRQWLQVGVAGFGFGNVMLLALPGYMGLDQSSGPWFGVLAGWLSLFLAFPVLVYSAADFWKSAWTAARRRVLTLELPIALGLAAIYAQSVYDVASKRGPGYCDSLTGLIFFLLCGRLFHRLTFDRMTFDRDYKGFFPLGVTRRTRATDGTASFENWKDETISISKLAVGDRLLIRHGELVPADARLVEGNGLIDYSFVTGESEPVPRQAGEHLFAGGRQMGGAIEVESVKPVSESYLTSLWDNEAFRKSKSATPADSQINRYSRRFTVAVVMIAIGAAVFWLFKDPRVAMKAFTSVLIVACPCALALAAPLTLGTAQRWLARRRVFLRNAEVIERMAVVDTIVLDKTGTLTIPAAGFASWRGEPLTEPERRWIGSMTKHSTHPLATRIGTQMGNAVMSESVSAFCETPGRGIEGDVAGRKIWIGSEEWLSSRGVALTTIGATQGSDHSTQSTGTAPHELRAKKQPECHSSGGNGSVVHVAIDGRYRGGFVLETVLRPEVETLIRRLRQDWETILLSGDEARETERFARVFGGTARLKFKQSPLDKLAVIQELQAAGHRVMMVGDGLNDAGALKQADVGVAVVDPVGTFSPASDVILDAGQLRRLVEVLMFCRRAARVVRAGFVVSGLYNVMGISIAAAGWLSPVVCAILMPLSSVSVVLFSIGATRWVAWRTFKESDRRQKQIRLGRSRPFEFLAQTVTAEGGTP